jgi:hypothetical protein
MSLLWSGRFGGLVGQLALEEESSGHASRCRRSLRCVALRPLTSTAAAVDVRGQFRRASRQAWVRDLDRSIGEPARSGAHSALSDDPVGVTVVLHEPAVTAAAVRVHPLVATSATVVEATVGVEDTHHPRSRVPVRDRRHLSAARAPRPGAAAHLTPRGRIVARPDVHGGLEPLAGEESPEVQAGVRHGNTDDVLARGPGHLERA